MRPHIQARLTALSGALLLAACGGSDSPTPDVVAPVAAPEEARPHDARTFTPQAVDKYADFETSAAGKPSFKALAGAGGETDRWTGTLDGAGYRIEVPKNWNGKLAVYAHGYAGTGETLTVNNPSIRRYLIDNGYAWVASSYSKNYYDVRAGVEDSNNLVLNFTKIAAANSRSLADPTKTYILGVSMGGHITAAAIEDEAYASAKHKVKYHGAVPMCGVVGDTDLFNYFSNYQAAAQTLAGLPSYPLSSFADIAALTRSSLFTTFSTVPTAQGLKLREIVKNLTGGERPIFNEGFGNSGLQNVVWSTFGGNGTVGGILTQTAVDTHRYVYQLDNDITLSAEEASLNANIPRWTEVATANRLRTDGLRWIPKVNGEFKIPVVSIHTLGDLYVPFSMEQVYRTRTVAKGNGAWLVQRAIRAPSHCDFTVVEQVNAFKDMVAWVETGTKPAGDDVLTKATVAAPAYGCSHTINTGGADDNPVTVGTRATMPACPAP